MERLAPEPALEGTGDRCSGGTAQREGISDGGDTETYYLKLNTGEGGSLDDWEIDVQLDKVKEPGWVDSVIPFADPFSTQNNWDKFIERPQLKVVNGIIQVTFKSVQDFPGWSFSSPRADLPFRVVARRKSDGVTVSQPGHLGLYDHFWNL